VLGLENIQWYEAYTAEVCHVVERHSMYADDSQIYTSVAVSDITSAVHCLAHCIADVNNWISDSSLRFNPSNFQDGDHVAGRGASAPTS